MLTRRVVAVAAATSAAALGLACAPASGASQGWVARYDGPAHGHDGGTSLAVDPSTHHVYVTGYSIGAGGHSDFMTLAYSGAGAKLWSRRFNGAAGGDDDAQAVAVDRGTHHVYVTGSSARSDGTFDYATVAYNGSGTRLWTRLYGSANNGNDRVAAMVVDPRTHRVYVTGWTRSKDDRYLTVAYSAQGRLLWARRGGSRTLNPWGIAVDRRNGHVYVTGGGVTASGASAYATTAYTAAGKWLWTRTFRRSGDVNDVALSIAVDPGTHHLFVTGGAAQNHGGDCVTIAYSSSGSRLWARKFANTGGMSIALDANSHRLYVTGSTDGPTSTDFATLAYSQNGTQLWVARYDGPSKGWDRANAVVVDGSTHNVYVTGTSYQGGSIPDNDYATLGYSRTGHLLWSSRYDGPAHGEDSAQAIAVDPTSHRVYVTGRSRGAPDNDDYATLAY